MLETPAKLCSICEFPPLSFILIDGLFSVLSSPTISRQLSSPTTTIFPPLFLPSASKLSVYFSTQLLPATTAAQHSTTQHTTPLPPRKPFLPSLTPSTRSAFVRIFMTIPLDTLINKLLRVKVKDGRYYFGSLVCTDRNCDLILENTTEKRPQHNTARFLGMVVIRGNNIETISTADS